VRTTDCPYCRAPAPVEGETQHAWDCPAPGPPSRFDWDSPAKRTAPPLRDTEFTPLPPLASLSHEERAQLAEVTRKIADAWAGKENPRIRRFKVSDSRT
jgi:hypothetical protein